MEGTYDERKQNIIKAATRVISKQGFHKFTFRQVAAEANISPGTLYYYYNSKNLILYDIVDYAQSQTAKLVTEMECGQTKPDEVALKVTEMIKQQVYDLNSNKIFLHLLHESLSGDNELAEKMKDKYNQWLDSFEKVIELHFGIPPGPINRSIAILLNAVIDGMSMMEIMGMETIERSEIECFFRLFVGAEFEKLASELRGRMASSVDA
ncbi:MAG: TetR/AcrR family transcriptional regulator [Ignavibacteriales bacterium]